MTRKRLIAWVLIMIFAIGLIAQPIIVAAATNDVRVAGANRYGTSYAVADALYSKSGSFDNVVVAYGGNFPDALSGGYLTKVKNAPLLLINQSEEGKVLSYIKNYMKTGGTVYLLGGTGVVSGNFETALKSQGINVKRLWGQGRYDTNLAILKESVKSGEEILVASGANYPDSLSGSSVGKGMLLVGKTLTEDQKSWLRSAGIKKFYILGGTGAVSTNIENELKGFGTVERIGGKNRWETSYLIAKKFFSDAKHISLACGTNFPDGLSGAPLAMANNSPIVLVSNSSYNYAQSFVSEKNIVNDTTIGGTAVISDTTVKTIMGQLAPTTGGLTFISYYVDPESDKFYDEIEYGVIVRNDTGKVINSINGQLAFLDSAGNILGSEYIGIDAIILPGQSVSITTFDEYEKVSKYAAFSLDDEAWCSVSENDYIDVSIKFINGSASFTVPKTNVSKGITKTSTNPITNAINTGFKDVGLSITSIQGVKNEEIYDYGEEIEIDQYTDYSVSVKNNMNTNIKDVSARVILMDEEGTILDSIFVYEDVTVKPGQSVLLKAREWWQPPENSYITVHILRYIQGSNDDLDEAYVSVIPKPVKVQ